MKRGFAVMGFTEAELGFVLAAAFAALGIASFAREDAARAAANAATNQLQEEHRGKVVAESTLQRLRDSLRKKSNKIPACSEKGESSAPIAEVVVLGGNSYLLAGDTITLADLQNRLAPAIATSVRLRCHFRIIAHAKSGVDATELAAATEPLWQFSDVSIRKR